MLLMVSDLLIFRFALCDRSLEKAGAETNRSLIVELGTNWGLVTKYTSYVAVEKRYHLWCLLSFAFLVF